MNISKSFRKLFRITAEYYDIVSEKSILENMEFSKIPLNNSVQKLIEFKDKYGLFIPGSDMIGKYIKFDNFHTEDSKTSYIYRVRGLYEPKEISSRFFINVDIFSKSDYNKQWHFQSDCIQDIDWLLSKDIKIFPKEKYDKMFIKEIGKDYLVSLIPKFLDNENYLKYLMSLGEQLYGKNNIIQPMPKRLFDLLNKEQKSLEPEFNEVIEENFDDLIAK